MRIDGMGDLLTLEGAARSLGTTRWVVYGYVRRRKVPTVRLGKSILVRLADLSGLETEAGTNDGHS